MLKQFLYLFLILSIFSCRSDEDLSSSSEDNDDESYDSTVVDLETYDDWTELTHSNAVEPDFSTVFPQTEVLRFDITISSSDWSSMQSDLASVLGYSSGRPGSTTTSDENPMWVPCSFEFEGKEWYNVGIRYKGNSSLQSAYQSGNNKLSFKLDFDQFEDDYPALKNQRFYGFKQLNLNNNYDDASLMREKVGADLFREFGLASSQTNFCVIYIDNGTGPQYYGVYTLVEEVDNTVITTQFADGSGNLYKPDGDAASFASGTYDESEFELKTNQDSADYSDVRALYDALHSSTRTSDVEAWKTELESVLDVDGFLKWLAANIVIQNWDTYGRMTHNYYLYNNPDNNLLTWIPWDNNEAFQDGKQSGALDISLSGVSSSWPLISYLDDVDEYKTIYKNYLQEFIDEVFIPSEMISTYTSYYNMLKEYAYAEESGYTYIYSDAYFDSAVSTLKTHVQSRNDVVDNYLN